MNHSFQGRLLHTIRTDPFRRDWQSPLIILAFSPRLAQKIEKNMREAPPNNPSTEDRCAKDKGNHARCKQIMFMFSTKTTEGSTFIIAGLAPQYRTSIHANTRSGWQAGTVDYAWSAFEYSIAIRTFDRPSAVTVVSLPNQDRRATSQYRRKQQRVRSKAQRVCRLVTRPFLNGGGRFRVADGGGGPEGWAAKNQTREQEQNQYQYSQEIMCRQRHPSQKIG